MAKLQKSIDKKNAVLAATLRLVNEGGFKSASMSKIAKTADVSPATIYLYFENKQDLINYLYLDIKGEFCSHVFENFKQTGEIKSNFEIVWYRMANFKLKNNEKGYFLTQCDNTPIVDELTLDKGIQLLKPLREVWENGIEKDLIKNVSPYLLYAFSIYPIAFLVNTQKSNKYKFKTECLNSAFQSAWDAIKK
jgi:AcrR family transcriptional regulator